MAWFIGLGVLVLYGFVVCYLYYYTHSSTGACGLKRKLGAAVSLIFIEDANSNIIVHVLDCLFRNPAYRSLNVEYLVYRLIITRACQDTAS